MENGSSDRISITLFIVEELLSPWYSTVDDRSVFNLLSVGGGELF